MKADATLPSQNPQCFLQRGRAPVLPATVKAELQHLLSSSPVLLSDFDEAFFKHFGQEFQYTQYGFSSVFEVLKSASDIIAIEQTAAGSLLTLKYHPESKTAEGDVLRGEASCGGALTSTVARHLCFRWMLLLFQLL